MSIQEKNNAINQVVEIIESIADKISTWNESPLPPETIESKSEDEKFGKMTVKMVSGIPECEEKISTDIKDTVRHNKYSLFYKSSQ